MAVTQSMGTILVVDLLPVTLPINELSFEVKTAFSLYDLMQLSILF